MQTGFEVHKRAWLFTQVLLVLAAWLFICWLHWDNDGLWFGDAPNHAANGLFWKEFLSSPSFQPKEYALSYHARYPVIQPTSYPPAFYFLEAIAFGMFGPSPYVAKGLVLGFVLMAGLYTTVWCRRWIGVEAGWAGAVLLLLPGVIRWSNCIMLNIPSVALSIGALYHYRRWLESPLASPTWRHLYAGAALSVLSILTYLTSCVVVLIAAIWLIIERRWRLLLKLRTLIVLVASTLILLPWALIVLQFERSRAVWATGNSGYITALHDWRWDYYLWRLPELFGTHLLIIALIGVIAGIVIRRWRNETLFMLIIMLSCYGFFTYVPAKEGRYILLMALPVVVFSMLALFSVAYCLSGMSWERARPIILFAVSLLLVCQAWLASKVHVMSISGYKELVAYLEKIAPDEPVFYDGRSYDAFTFFVQSRDPGYRRRVVLGRKLLYAEGISTPVQGFVSSAEEVVEVLRKKGGCQWVVVDDQPETERIAAPLHLREAVKGHEFKLVKKMPITRRVPEGIDKTNVSIYRFLAPIEPVDEIVMPHFSLGEDVYIRVKPLER